MLQHLIKFLLKYYFDVVSGLALGSSAMISIVGGATGRGCISTAFSELLQPVRAKNTASITIRIFFTIIFSPFLLVFIFLFELTLKMQADFLPQQYGFYNSESGSPAIWVTLTIEWATHIKLIYQVPYMEIVEGPEPVLRSP